MSFINSLAQSKPYAWPLQGHWQLESTAVIVIDMQRDFLDPQGYFGALGESTSHLVNAIEPAKKFLANIRQHDVLIIHTRESHRPELVDLHDNKRLKAERQQSPVGSQGPLGRLLVRGEAGCDFFEGFAPAKGEIVVDKPGNSAFYATDLEHILRVKRIKHIVLLGVTTDVCVSSTMRDANDRGFDCVLLQDCCGAATEQLHLGVLASIEREGGIFGAYCDSDELIGEIERKFPD
ncbi:MAG: isochorismatase family cysteine hydrolase [Cellvibrio sp.]|uniref:cysteine hydrolase family protein n=1 Tax=Cellvibrio sp. TaxID=1965322 RepID=UPI0031AB53E6